jgi:hypothetical protein
MWTCVCEYLVIWCDKTTVHEITDCSSIKQTPSFIHKLRAMQTKHCITGNICNTVYKLKLQHVSEQSHLLYCFSRTIYSVLNATIFTFISPPYKFRPQTAIIMYFVYAKTVALHKMYKMFTYLHT